MCNRMKEQVGLRYNRGLTYRVYEGFPQSRKRHDQVEKMGIGYEQEIHKIQDTNDQ